MSKKFYIVIFCILSCSVLLLGLSYSKNSNDMVDDGLIESSNDNFRVVYSSDRYLDTRDNNTLRMSLINQKDSNTNYALYLQEVDSEDYQGVYYSINGGSEYLLTDNIIFLGELSEYGVDGDAMIFDVSLRSNEEYSFYYSVGEYELLDEVSYGS